MPAIELPVALNVAVDWRVLAASATLAAVAVFLAGVLPALRGTADLRGGGLHAVLASGARGSTAARRRGVRTLVVAQLACSLVALVGAALFARSLGAIDRLDPGVRAPDRVLVALTDLGLAGHAADSAGRGLVARWVERVRALPGVESATVSDFVPLGFNSTRNTFVPATYRARPGEETSVLFNAVGDDYFATLGVPVVRGRAFTARDDAAAPAVAIVNEAYVRRYLAGREPVGARAHYNTTATGAPVTIVGVTRDGRYATDDLAGEAQPFVYVPWAQRPSASLFLQVRVRPGLDPLAVAPAAQAALAAVDPALPLVRPTTLDRWMAAGAFVQRIGARVLAALAALALALAAVGLYAVMVHAVASRRREIGVRVALGATTQRVVGGVLGDAGRTTAIGLGVGGVAAFGAARLLRTQLVGVSPDDPTTYAAAAALLAAVALLASWLPARRVARVHPTEALRAE
jgi:putative ABC transport system permease protein